MEVWIWIYDIECEGEDENYSLIRFGGAGKEPLNKDQNFKELPV